MQGRPVERGDQLFELTATFAAARSRALVVPRVGNARLERDGAPTKYRDRSASRAAPASRRRGL